MSTYLCLSAKAALALAPRAHTLLVEVNSPGQTGPHPRRLSPVLQSTERDNSLNMTRGIDELHNPQIA